MKSHHKKKNPPTALATTPENVASDLNSASEPTVQDEPKPERWVLIRGWQYHISQVVFLSIILLSILSYLLISNY